VTYSLSTLSQKSANVAELGDCRRCLAVFCDSVDRALGANVVIVFKALPL